MCIHHLIYFVCSHALKSKQEVAPVIIAPSLHSRGSLLAGMFQKHILPIACWGLVLSALRTHKMLVKYKKQKPLLRQLATEKSLATVRNLYYIAHVTRTPSFGEIRWHDSNKLQIITKTDRINCVLETKKRLKK